MEISRGAEVPRMAVRAGQRESLPGLGLGLGRARGPEAREERAMQERMRGALDAIGRVWLARAAVIFALSVAWSFATAAAFDGIQLSVGADGTMSIGYGSISLDGHVTTNCP